MHAQQKSSSNPRMPRLFDTELHLSYSAILPLIISVYYPPIAILILTKGCWPVYIDAFRQTISLALISNLGISLVLMSRGQYFLAVAHVLLVTWNVQGNPMGKRPVANAVDASRNWVVRP